MTKKGYFFIAQLYKYLNKFQGANIFSRKLSQLNGVAHHVVVDVNIFLGDCDAAMLRCPARLASTRTPIPLVAKLVMKLRRME